MQVKQSELVVPQQVKLHKYLNQHKVEVYQEAQQSTEISVKIFNSEIPQKLII